jgi:preprotein translocase subunit SecF
VSLASRLYHGQTSVDFVGHWRRWFLLSGIAMLLSVIALFYPGLRFGLDFRGGGLFTATPSHPVTQGEVSSALGPVAKVVQLTGAQPGKPAQVVVQTEPLDPAQTAQVRAKLAKVAGVQPNQVETTVIGSKWGSTVSRKAIQALIAFLVVVTVYVSIRMEFKMAVAALIALMHDLLITAGIYALARFEVTPATVIALLTILGYSLYDTVVVFDKVRENTGELTSMSRITWSEAANRAVNQTVVRSLNTSLTSLLPIGALLFVGAALLGAETIKDLALALFVGVTTGTYSSIFIATPLVALWKEREPRNQQLRARVARLAVQAQPQPAAALAGGGGGGKGKDARRSQRQAVRAVNAGDGQAGDRAAPEPATTLETEGAGEQETGQEPAAVPAPRPQPPQKPRPAQQRRKPSGRQASRPAKRRRR